MASRGTASAAGPRAALRRALSVFALRERPQGRALLPLFWASAASLYLEVLLIRWIGTEVRVFAYFQNLALIACFLGFGLGCYRAQETKRELFGAVALAALVVIVAFPGAGWKRLLDSLSSGLALSPDAAIWSAPGGLGDRPLALFAACAGLIAVLLVLLVAVMAPLGQWVGSYLDSAQDVVAAYTVNLLGSLAGM